jgi:GH25 family lysozyme M1 (1,4-beta-N-acetylmuramidase)
LGFAETLNKDGYIPGFYANTDAIYDFDHQFSRGYYYSYLCAFQNLPIWLAYWGHTYGQMPSGHGNLIPKMMQYQGDQCTKSGYSYGVCKVDFDFVNDASFITANMW